MNLQVLRDEADGWQRDADLLLQHLRLLDALSQCGSVQPVGAYAYGLMMSGDIDMHILNPGMQRSDVLRVHQALLDNETFYRVIYYDHRVKREEGMPLGWFVGGRLPWKGRDWKFDLWFVAGQDMGTTWVPAALNLEARDTILRLKHWRNQHNPRLSSVIIYEAVLRHGIRDVDGFLAFLSTSG